MINLCAHKSTPEFWKAYAKLCNAMPNIEPDAVNTHANSAKYIKLNALIALIKPVLTKHDFFIVDETLYNKESEQYEIHSTLRHLTHEGHLTTVFAIVREKTNKQGIQVPDAQAFGGSLTYGRRYNTFVLLRITTGDDDDDGNSISVKGIEPFTQPMNSQWSNKVSPKSNLPL